MPILQNVDCILGILEAIAKIIFSIQKYIKISFCKSTHFFQHKPRKKQVFFDEFN
jgi:hypothetical protein